MFSTVDISREITSKRKALGMTQAALAARAGVSRGTIAKLETNRLPEVTLRTAMRLLVALGLDLQVTLLQPQRPTLDELRAEHEAEE